MHEQSWAFGEGRGKLGKDLSENRRLNNFKSSHMTENSSYYYQPKWKKVIKEASDKKSQTLSS